MPLHALECAGCGAPLKDAPEQGDRLVCKFCGHAHVFHAAPVPTETPNSAYEVGDRVLIEWGSRFWSGEILEVRDGQRYLIHYSGWSSSWDEEVGPGRLRPDESPPGLSTRGSGGSAKGWRIALRVVFIVTALLVMAFGCLWFVLVQDDAATNPGPVAVEPGEGYGPVDVDGALPVGAHVQVLWQNQWYAATTLSPVSEGSVRVHYDGWADSWDEDVTLDRVRVRRAEEAESMRAAPVPVPVGD